MFFPVRLQSNGVAGLRRGLGLVALAGLGACGTGHEADCLKSNGPTLTQRRPLDHRLRSVVVYDNADLLIVPSPDTATYAEVLAGEHVIDGLTLTYPSPHTLAINNTNRCNWARSYNTPYEVRLHLPRRSYLNLEQRGIGTLSTASRWTQDTLFVHLVGAGDVKLDVASTYINADMYELGDLTFSGTADVFNILVGGTGFLFAGGLRARACYFRTNRNSLGDGHVQATQNLGGTLDGKGTFYYSGQPAVIDVRGSGKLVPE